MLKKMIKKYGVTILGVVLGALGGYLYWYYIGCTTGDCPITSSPVNSSLWGALFLGLIFNMFDSPKKKN